MLVTAYFPATMHLMVLMVAADYDERYAEWFPSDLPQTELTHHEQACLLHLEQLCSQDDVAALMIEFVRAQVSCAAYRLCWMQ